MLSGHFVKQAWHGPLKNSAHRRRRSRRRPASLDPAARTCGFASTSTASSSPTCRSRISDTASPCPCRICKNQQGSIQ